MSQKDTVLRHLKSNSYITPLTAIGVYGVYRLAARIADLRQEGHNITTSMAADAAGRPYARYKLVA